MVEIFLPKNDRYLWYKICCFLFCLLCLPYILKQHVMMFPEEVWLMRCGKIPTSINFPPLDNFLDHYSTAIWNGCCYESRHLESQMNSCSFLFQEFILLNSLVGIYYNNLLSVSDWENSQHTPIQTFSFLLRDHFS